MRAVRNLDGHSFECSVKYFIEYSSECSIEYFTEYSLESAEYSLESAVNQSLSRHRARMSTWATAWAWTRGERAGVGAG